MKVLPALLAAAALAACGDAKHEPVKLIAAPRPPPAELPLTAALPLPAAAPAASAAPAAAPAALAASAAALNRDVVRPGFIDRSAAPPRMQPGEPNGNDAFRRAVEARAAKSP